MILLVSGATRDVAKYGQLGVLVSPRSRNAISRIAASGRFWAADNDAFLAWDESRFQDLLSRIGSADRSKLLWVACPDVLGDAQATLDRWKVWLPKFNAGNIPAAFVGQDGLENMADEIPWSQMSAFFVGGSTGWKLSHAAENLVRTAKERGKWVHIGRVNTSKRIRHAIELGADSIDGGGFSRWPKRIPKAVRWIRQHRQQRPLF